MNIDKYGIYLLGFAIFSAALAATGRTKKHQARDAWYDIMSYEQHDMKLAA